jgi:hypothetical protein
VANYRAVAIAAAKRNGIDPNVFVRQINQESGFNPNARSGAGAIGIAQIVPHWHPGIDATDPVASLNYAAHLMGTLYRKYGNYAEALSVYNSGRPDAYKDPQFSGGQTFNYVKDILGSSKAPAAPTSTPQAPGLAPTPVAPTAPTAPLAAPSTNLRALLRQGLNESSELLGMPKMPNIPLPGLAAPTLTPAPAMGAPSTPLPTGGSAPVAPRGLGKVILSKTADRSGVPIQTPVLTFVSTIAGIAGRPLTIGTGTNHNQFVEGTHRVSDHWDGYAADIPATGSTLTQLGQDALVAAGADPKWARAQKGGLYNIGGKQIIFNSMEGGNHFNHLHVGIRTR